ncbi:hypothetical protein ACFQ14_00045 [Pseudahrensia aquimaris]|uniref:Uncharacterized protein n=1 Tax=Pseudahrensia aquimaris TaxID=744461 RepID=A0ABW3FBY5_9HYPH
MHCSRLFKPLLLIGMVVSATPAASQDCFVCDEVVILDTGRANCFLQRFDALQKDADASPKARILVDFTECTGLEVDAVGTRGGFTPVEPGDVLRDDLRSSYILDIAGLACVRELLGERLSKGLPIDPTIRIDLVTDCEL